MPNGTIITESAKMINDPSIFVELISHITPTAWDLLWFIFLVILFGVIFLWIKNWMEKLASYISIRFFDRYLNVGSCIDYQGFFGTVKKITFTYILLEKVTDTYEEDIKIYRKIPIKQFDENYKDFYEIRCSQLCNKKRGV